MQYDLNRRGFVKLAAAGGIAAGLSTALASCSDTEQGGSGGSDLELTSFSVFSTKDAQHSAQLAYATAKDMFADEGLDVTVDYTLNGIDMASLAGSGGVKIMSGGVDQAFAMRQQGIEFDFLMKLTQIQGAQGVILKPGLTLASPNEIEGKRIGMYTGAAVDLAIRNFCKAEGVNYEALDFVNLEAPEQVVALARGDIDIMACWEPYVTAAQDEGGTLYFTGSTSYVHGSPEPVNWLYAAVGVLVEKEFVAESPNTLQALMRVLIKATDEINADKAAAAAVLAPELGIPEETAQAALEANVYDQVVDTTFIEGVDDFLAWAADQGFLEDVWKTGQGVDWSLLKQVDPGLVEVEE